MIRALIVVEACFLSAGQVCQIGGAVHRNGDRPVDLPCCDRQVRLQPLERANPGRCIDNNRTASSNLSSRRDKFWQQYIGPGRVRLDHQCVAEAVDHDTRQSVAFGMNQPIEWFGVKPFSQIQGRAKTLFQPGTVDLCLWVGIQQACCDPAFRIECSGSQALLAIRQDDDGSGAKAARAPIHGDLVSECPGGAASAEPANLAGAQLDDWFVHGPPDSPHGQKEKGRARTNEPAAERLPWGGGRGTGNR